MPLSRTQPRCNGTAIQHAEPDQDAESARKAPPLPIIIDTDPGIDDAMAIVYAFSVADLNVLSLTSVFGNVSIDRTTRNALALTELCGTETLVFRGAAKPLAMPVSKNPFFVHGDEGFGDIPAPSVTRSEMPMPAAKLLSRVCAAQGGEIVLVALGPLTNLAAALEFDPSIADNVARVVVMGGSLRAGGNISKFAEFNIWKDPHAADKVFAANWPVQMIGLDVTLQVSCSRDDFVKVGANGRKGAFLKDAVEFYFRYHKDKRGVHNIVHMHDPSAVIAAHASHLFTFEEVPLNVVLDGERIGETIVSKDTDRPLIRVATGVDGEAVRKLWMTGIGAKE